MTTPLTVEDYIVQFKSDVGLVHQFANGADNEVVHSEGGDYPTLANLVKQYQTKLELLSQSYVPGMVVRQYRFSLTDTLTVTHNLATDLFEVTIVDDTGNRHCAIPISEITGDAFTLAFASPLAGRMVVTFYTSSIITAIDSGNG